MPDYYNLLGVPAGADAEAIRLAFRSRAKQAHPDTQPGGSPAEREALKRRFILLAQAYDTLRDPARRAAYDRTRQARLHAEHARGGTAPGARAAEGSASWRSTRARFGHARRAPADAEPSGSEENLESLLYDAEALLARFGLDLRHPLEELLDALLAWALGVFRQTVDAWEQTSSEGTSARGDGTPAGGSARRGAEGTAKKKERAPEGEPAIEEELRRLKRRRGGRL